MTPLQYAELLHETLADVEQLVRALPGIHRKVIVMDLCIDEVLKYLEKEEIENATDVPF